VGYNRLQRPLTLAGARRANHNTDVRALAHYLARLR
jgi:hypothetical protein